MSANEQYKTYKSLEQYLRRKKVKTPGKHATFFLNLFFKNTLNKTNEQFFYIKYEDIKKAQLIPNTQSFKQWQEEMFLNGIFISKTEENYFEISSGILNYKYKEEFYHSKKISKTNAIEESRQNLISEINKLKEEIKLLKEAIDDTNSKIVQISNMWKLRSTFASKKEIERQIKSVNQFTK